MKSILIDYHLNLRQEREKGREKIWTPNHLGIQKAKAMGFFFFSSLSPFSTPPDLLIPPSTKDNLTSTTMTLMTPSFLSSPKCFKFKPLCHHPLLPQVPYFVTRVLESTKGGFFPLATLQCPPEFSVWTPSCPSCGHTWQVPSSLHQEKTKTKNHTDTHKRKLKFNTKPLFLITILKA